MEIGVASDCWFSHRWAKGEWARIKDPFGLTARQSEILHLQCRGYRNKLIASELCVSQDTIKTQIREIYRKLGCRDRTAAANHPKG